MQEFTSEIREIKTLLALRFKPILNVEEAAAFLGMAKSYVYQLKSQHALPYFKSPQGGLYFSRRELEAWMTDTHYPSMTQLKDNPEKYIKRK